MMARSSQILPLPRGYDAAAVAETATAEPVAEEAVAAEPVVEAGA